MNVWQVLTRITNVRVSRRPADVAQLAGDSESVAFFGNPRALTFPVIVGLVKGAWAALQGFTPSLSQATWIPLLLCLALGMLVTIAGLADQRPSLKPLNWLIGLVVGFLNCLVMFGAVLSISPGSTR